MCSDSDGRGGRHRRRVAAALSAAYALVIIYASLVPLRRVALSPDQAWRAFHSIQLLPFSGSSKSDLLANVLLTVPYGACLAAMLTPGRARFRRRVLTTVAVCAAAASLGMVVEFLQVFFPERTPSLNDVAAQTLGAFIGALLWQSAGPSLTAAADHLRHDQPRAAGFVLAFTVYAALYAVVAWSPFDFSLRPAEVWQKYREGRLSLGLLPPGPLAIVDMVRTMMTVAPLGWLGATAAARWHPPFRTRAMPLALSAVIVGASELGQVLVLSRHASLGDVLFGIAGVVLGGLAVQAPRTARAAQSSETRLGVRLGAAVLGAAVVVAWSWRPFNFVLSHELARDRLPGLFQVPLQGYLAADPFNALADATAKVALALALGVLFGATMPVTVARPIRTIVAAVALLGVYTLAEIGQLFLPGRYPDSTDILLGVVAGSLGCAVYAALRK